MSANIIASTMQDAIASCVPALVVRLDEGEILWATPPAEDLFGYIEGELQGKNLEILIPERFRDLHAKHLANFSQHPAKRMMGAVIVPLLGLHRDGMEFPVEIGLYPRAVVGWRCAVATILKMRA